MNTRRRAQDPGAQHAALPPGALAHLDLGVFSAPGPLTFSLFAHGFSLANWAGWPLVLVGTGIAGLRGKMPGVEPRPYILRFDEDKPNPLYRRVCYTFAWNAVLNFALLNLAALVDAVATGVWRMKQIYYSALRAAVRGDPAARQRLGKLPRVGRSTKGEGTERRYFYGSVWAVTAAQTMLLVLWKTLPLNSHRRAWSSWCLRRCAGADGHRASRGMLPRTRPIFRAN